MEAPLNKTTRSPEMLEQNLSSKPGTMGEEGKRIKLYPSESKGPFYNKRKITAWILVLFYLGLPFISYKGYPIFQLDIFERRMILVGNLFYPSDVVLFWPMIVSIIFLVFAVTALLGRIWCGWACPQTVFLQYIFEPIERLIEGKAYKRKQRDEKGFSADWLWRKILKHALFFSFSFLIGNTFLAYFVGVNQVLHWVTSSPSNHLTAFTFVLLDTALFYWIFAHFKEQACVLVCPYARFQSVLTDSRTWQVTYDYERGEPRGRAKKDAASAFGDCVDCKQCIKVCPTGIDIRQGPQLECIGCSKCMDACDSIMDTWKKPKGLIRYTSEESVIKKAAVKLLKPRFFVYSSLILVLWTIFGFLMMTRNFEQTEITRKGSQPYLVQGDSVINIYSFSLRNKTIEEQEYQLKIPEGLGHSLSGQTLKLRPGELQKYSLVIEAPKNAFTRGKKEIDLVVTNGSRIHKFKTMLLGPYAN